jgi:hypothetical protein
MITRLQAGINAHASTRPIESIIPAIRYAEKSENLGKTSPGDSYEGHAIEALDSWHKRPCGWSAHRWRRRTWRKPA